MTPSDERDDNTPIHGVPQLTKRDLMNAAKDGFKELVREQVTAFGWWSAKTFGLALLAGVAVFVLWVNGFGKVHS